jgi:rifampicin phosphotransferase
MAPPLVVGLAQATELDPERVGSQAANLARLNGAGFRVPPALAITAAGYERWSELREELTAKLESLGGTPLAVRSSAVAEDLTGVLRGVSTRASSNVGRDALEVAAVRRCWESASVARVAAYQKSHAEAGGALRVGMAVIVQRLVRADAAGVAFTANPVSGNRHEIVVTAVRGLGERRVSGPALGTNGSSAKAGQPRAA